MRAAVLALVLAVLTGEARAVTGPPPSLQDRVITDSSPVPDAAPRPALPDAGFTPDVPRRENGGRRWELVVGLAGFSALLVYALLRWQARAARRG